MQIPVVVISIFISLYFFYSFNKRNRLKNERRRAHLDDVQERLLTTLREKPNKVQNVAVSDTTGDAIKNHSR